MSEQGRKTFSEAAAVAFMVATSANWRECTRARREDIDPESGWVYLRGTRRQSRKRRFVVAHPALLSLLRYAVEHPPGQDLLFPPWTNVRRDLIDACKRAGSERCSPNDLRRTYGRWMRIAAFPDEIIAPTMVHADTRMLDRVYGKLSPEELSRRLLLHARAALPDCRGLQPPPRRDLAYLEIDADGATWALDKLLEMRPVER
jgi:integrase